MVNHQIIHKNRHKIFIFNSSSPPNREKFLKSLEFIRKNYSFFLLIEDELYEEKDVDCPSYLFKSPIESAIKFTRILLDKNIDAIWCSRGGYGILKWINLIKWDDIDINRLPLIIGFSDVTFLHSIISKLNGFSLHAPLFTTFIDSSTKSKELFVDFFKGKLYPLDAKVFKSGYASGRLIGGNLTCIVHSIGTAYEPPWEESILFLEDHNEAPYRIDRMLTHLLLSGRLSKVRGICFGEFYYKNEKIDVYEILKVTINELDIPILYDIKVGHGGDNYPLLMGWKYNIDGFNGVLVPDN